MAAKDKKKKKEKHNLVGHKHLKKNKQVKNKMEQFMKYTEN